MGSPPRTRRNASSLNSSVYATFGILFIDNLQQLYYPSLPLVPDNRWEAHIRLACEAAPMARPSSTRC
jgi:hypothetical protein